MKQGVLVSRGHCGSSFPIIAIDENIFIDTEVVEMDKPNMDIDIMNESVSELLDEGTDEFKENCKPIEPNLNKINRFDRFMQDKKNKQQFKNQKFNPKVAGKFSGKNNMNLRRGGGR